MLFRAAQSASQRALLLDDELVVFNPESWDTHILNAAAALVFSHLAAAPRSEENIENLLAEALADDARADCSAHANRLLGELLALGLIEAAADDGAPTR